MPQDNPRDLKSYKLYECVFCKNSQIHENKLGKHHQHFHSQIPYGSDQYVCLKYVEAKRQCIICDEVLSSLKIVQVNHHKNHHSEFKSWKDLFEVMLTTTDTNGNETKSWRKPTVNCNRCKKRIHRRDLVEHFQAVHPAYFTRTGNHVAIQKEQCHTAGSVDGANVVDTDKDDESHFQQFNREREWMDEQPIKRLKPMNNHGNDGDEDVRNKFVDRLNYFICLLCNKRKRQEDIKEDHLLSHHNMCHPDVPYQASNFKLESWVETKFQCHLCQIVVRRSERRFHHLKFHPEFANIFGVFKRVFLTVDAINNKMTWSANKDVNMMTCRICKTLLHRNSFAEHLKLKHPECFTSNENHAKIENETGSEPMHGEIANSRDNFANDNEVTNENEPSDNVLYFRCKFCKNEVAEFNLFKHHKKFHPKIPYEANDFRVRRSVETKFQCNLCKIVLNCAEHQNHQQNCHPEFVNFFDVFSSLMLTTLTNNTRTWSNNKDADVVPCTVCQTKVDRNCYVEHFQQEHPDRITSTGNQMKMKKIPSSEPLHVDIVGVNAASGNQAVENRDSENCGSNNDDTTINKNTHEFSNSQSVPSIEKKYQCYACQTVVNPLERRQHQQEHHPEFKSLKYLFLLVRLTRLSENQFKLSENKNQGRCKLCKIDIEPNTFIEHFKLSHPEWYEQQCSAPERILPPKKIKKEKDDKTTKNSKKSGNSSIGMTREIVEIIPPEEIKKEKVDPVDKEPIKRENNDSIGTQNKSMALIPPEKIKKEKFDPVDDEPIKSFFNCTICGKRKIKGKKLIKHHTKVHPGVPYLPNTYILNKKERKSSCVSNEVVAVTNDPKRNEENRSDHSNVQMNEDESKDEAISSISTNAVGVNNQDGNDNRMNEPTADKINDAGRNASAGPGEFFTIVVSCAELQRLLQSHRIYSHNGQFILKDSTTN